MNLQAESLTDSDIADVAAYLSSVDWDNGESVNGGRQAGREKSTACHACHGEDGQGVEARYPKLAGQYESYLAKALTDYRDGERDDDRDRAHQ